MSKIVEGAALIAGAVGLMVFAPELAPLLGVMTSTVFDVGVGAALMGGALESEGIAAAISGSNNPFSIRQAAAPWQIIYGQTRVSGTIVYCSSSGSKKEELNLVIVWAGHPCESIDTIWIDGRRVYLDGKTTSGAPLTDPDNIVLDMQGNPTAGSAPGGNHQDFNGNHVQLRVGRKRQSVCL